MLSRVSHRACAHAVRCSARRTLATASPSDAYKVHGPRDDLKRSLYVRPRDGIVGMAEAMAYLRALERKYGKLRLYTFLRDEQTLDVYQAYFFVEFERDEDLEAIPLGRQIIHLEMPYLDRPPPGGVGLHELNPFLYPQDRLEGMGMAGEPELASSPAPPEAAETTQKPAEKNKPMTRWVEATIERNHQKPFVYSDAALSAGKRAAIGTAFARWGGFYTPPAEQPDAPEEDDFSLADLQAPVPAMQELRQPSRKYMKSALRIWAPQVRQVQREAEWERYEAQRASERQAAAAAAQHDAQVMLEAEAAKAAKAARTAAAAAATAVKTPPQASASKKSPDEEASKPKKAATPDSQSSSQQTQASRKRERMLELARKSARASDADSAKEPSAQQAKPEENKPSIRDRLSKLIGGTWF